MSFIFILVSIGRIQLGCKCTHLFLNILGTPTRKLQSSPISNCRSKIKEVFAYICDRLAFHFGRLQQIATFVRDAINPAMFMVTVGVPHIVLHVPDERIVPITNIKRTISTDGMRAQTSSAI